MSTWIPLESDPDVLNRHIHKLGVSKKWALVDVIGLDAEMLESIPKPVKAVILLFTVSENYEKHRAEEQERLKANPEKYPGNLFFMRQTTRNACATVAIIHSMANNMDVALYDGLMKKFLKKAKNMTPEERGQALESDLSFTADHQELAQEGQTAANVENVRHHFIALVKKKGVLYELDGRKSLPINHGRTTEETFFADAAKVCQQFMARDPSEQRFAIMALAPAQK